tara:strand:- start:1195 stop:8091 length:6897 start_codon:yes stop_codon:yes gene_type:complete
MDEIFYVTPNGSKVSESELLEEYGDELFDQLVNEGQLKEFVEEETPEINFNGGSFYETPSGEVFSEGDLINEFGVDVFNQVLDEGQLKKKDSPGSISSFSSGTSGVTTSPSPGSNKGLLKEENFFKGNFGAFLNAIDFGTDAGLGDLIDDMGRAAQAGFENGQIAESGNDLLLGGTNASLEDIQEFISKNENALRLGPSQEMQNYQKIYNEEKADGNSVWGFVKGIVLNPGIIPEIMVSSFAGMAGNKGSAAAAAATIGTGATLGATTGSVGGPVGGAAGALAGAAASIPYAFAAGSTVLETGLTYGELLQARLEEKGEELTAKNVQNLLQNEEVVKELRFDAVARGLAIGTIDALTGRLGGKIAKPFLTKAGSVGSKAAAKALKRKAIGSAALVESVGGSIGETAGITATNLYGDQGQEYDTGEILLEGIAEAPGSVKDLIAVRYQNPKYKVNGKKATVEEIDALIDGMTYEQLTAPNLKIEIDNDFEGRKEKLHNKILEGRTKQSVMAANPDLNGPTVDAIVTLERQVQELEGRVLGTVTGKNKIADLKSQIKNLQENQLEAEAVEETEAVIEETERYKDSQIPTGKEIYTLETEEGEGVRTVEVTTNKDGSRKIVQKLDGTVAGSETLSKDNTLETKGYVESAYDNIVGESEVLAMEDVMNPKMKEKLTTKQKQELGISEQEKPKTVKDSQIPTGKEVFTIETEEGEGVKTVEVTTNKDGSRSVVQKVDGDNAGSQNIPSSNSVNNEDFVKGSFGNIVGDVEVIGMEDVMNPKIKERLTTEQKKELGMVEETEDASPKIYESINDNLEVFGEFTTPVNSLNDFDNLPNEVNKVINLGQKLDSENITWEINRDLGVVDGRQILEIKTNNGDKFLMYNSTGRGTGADSKGQWVPMLGFAKNGGFIKGAFNPETGKTFTPTKPLSNANNPKFNKYGSETFKNIAEQLAKGETSSVEVVSEVEVEIQPIENISGFERVMDKIKNIVKKKKSRNTKESTNPKEIEKAAIDYLQKTKVYENSSDIQREAMVRKVRESIGIKEKKAPTPKAAIKKAEKSLGLDVKEPSKITLTEKQAIASQIKSLNRGAKDAIKSFVNASKILAEEVSQMVEKGKITTKQAAAIIKRFTKVNMLNDASVDSFVDYMSRVFENANFAEEVSIARKKRPTALKNIRTKIGIAKSVSPNLNKIFSIKNPASIPQSVFQDYLNLINVFGERSSVLSPSDIAEVEKTTKKILDAIDLEISEIPRLSDVFNLYENKILNDKGDVDYAATLKQMLKDGEVDADEVEIMKKYKSEISPSKPVKEKTKAELELEKQSVIEQINETKALQISSLPSRLERAAADKFNSLINDIDALNGLSTQELKQVLKLINNINNGFLPSLVVTMNSKMEAVLQGAILGKSIEKGKILPISKLYSRLKSKITKRGAVLEAIRRNPLYYVDQIFGDSKTKNIFNSVFNSSAKAQEAFTYEYKKILGKLEKAEQKVSKSFKSNSNKTLRSSFKQMVYMIQLEHDSNLNNPETKNQAAAYIKKTIESIDTGETSYTDDDAIMLAEILEKFKNKETGEIDNEKLYNSFNKAEKESIETIQEVNLSLAETAEYTSSIIRGDNVTLRNNYVHLNVLSEAQKGANIENSLGVASGQSYIEQFNKGLKPSTKAKSLIKRTGSVSPLNFNVYASASRGSKGVLLDFHMTEPIKTARRTINEAEKFLKGDKARMDSDLREKFNAIKQANEEVVENLLTNAYQQTTLGEDALIWLQKNGYRAILASGTRFVAELTSNTFFAIMTAPISFVTGAKIGMKFLNSDSAPLSMKNLGSKLVTRLYSNQDMSGRMIDANIINQSSNPKTSKSKGKISNKIAQIWNRTGAKYQGAVATVADGLISTPDKVVMRPMWFGTFKSEFKAITGVDPDMEKIAANDEVYMKENKEALKTATELADQNAVMTGGNSNPFMGILKGTKKANDSGIKTAINAFNGFMTTFLIYEYITARTGIVNAVGMGSLTKTKGAALMAGSATRMIMYTMMANILGEMLASIAGEEEEPKDLEKQLGQAIASSVTSLVLGRDFGNITKGIMNAGIIEPLNREYGGPLRDGEYDVYKDGLSYQIIPNNKDGRGTSIGEIATNMAAAFGPAIKTLDFAVKKATSAPKKTPQGKALEEAELMYRLPLEILGNTGLIPMYRDVRRLVLRDIYSEMNKASNDLKDKKKREKEKLGIYNSRSDMKRYNYRLWYDTFGPNSPDYESEQQLKEEKRREYELKKRLKDRENNYYGGSSGFGSGDSFGGGGSFGKGRKTKKAGKDTFGSSKFGN